jgi:methylmalonyl-CoA mutase cobalamin-binding subunit
MGTMTFARNDAMALAHEIGSRWEAGLLPISSEYMATGILRSLLLDRLDSIRSSDGVGPRIIFATPSGERHDLGLLVASLVAASKGAEVVFMGAEVPLEDLTLAVEGSRASVLDLGFVTEDSNDVAGCLKNVRRRHDQRVTLWGGGRGMTRVESVSGVDRIEYFDRLKGFVLEARGNDYASTQQPLVWGGAS